MNTNDIDSEMDGTDEKDIYSGIGVTEMGLRIGMAISKEIARGIFNKLTKPIVVITAINENKRPVKDVTVTLGDKHEVTASSGRAIFENMRPGKYAVSVKYGDKVEQNIDVLYLENGERATLSLTLRNTQFFTEKGRDRSQSVAVNNDVNPSLNPHVSQNARPDIAGVIGMVKNAMTDWCDYLSEEEDDGLYWSTNSNASTIYILFGRDEEDGNYIDVVIGLYNEHPRKNNFSQTKRSYLELDDPGFFAEDWEWDSDEYQMCYRIKLGINEISEKTTFLRDGLLEWSKFLGINGISLLKN